MGRAILPTASEDDLQLMESILRTGRVEHRFAVRIQAVLARAYGKSTTEVASFLGIDAVTVSRFVHRFNSGGVNALVKNATKKPGKAPISDAVKNELCRIVCNEEPADATHWSTRELGKRLGIGHTAVNNILRERGLKPHLVRSFQFSTDPDFESKLEDVVGLYLNPPENSIVLCVDEKSQIQALERTQPVLPIVRGIPERQTTDYYRHGTTTLFAAINIASGKVIGECKESHKAKDYISFLRKIDRSCPKGKVLHIVADNYATHKTKEVREYLAEKQGRFVEHFIPTHSSWLNTIERWFAEITNKRIRRESWTSVAELKAAIIGFIRVWNDSGKKFTWTRSASEIRKSISNARNAYAD